MGIINSPWENPPAPTPDAGGTGIISRGTDPLINTGGSSGLQPIWDNAPVSTPEGSETANPVSGMPTTPSRWEPSSNPPPPPDLKDRNPGTIDER